ncbi:MAG: membrane protein insertase YidC [Caldimicrobium sp.]|nr:membrane protein insertase YidC [Caldimicrobium sp.]MCX7873341.1 membrane protein insertase YidC [Caldimicrobium sp.]MDW8093421.1 membrane protein insertase YidC [Caldimicrobium sp.]
MDNRVFWAIILSMVVLLLFHYLYISYYAPQPKLEEASPKVNQTESIKEAKVPMIEEKNLLPVKDLSIKTPLFEAMITSSGARFKEFKLLKYYQDLKKQNPIDMVSSPTEGLPFEIYLASMPQVALLPFEVVNQSWEPLYLRDHERISLPFKTLAPGLEIEKTYTFKGDSYYIDLEVKITNTSNETLKDRLLLRGVFAPFSKGSDYVFKGPFYYTDHLIEVELKDTLTEYLGPLKYLGYMDVYFESAVIPLQQGNYKATFRKLSKELAEFILWTEEFSLSPKESLSYSYKIYLGPKRTEDLKREFPLLAKSLYFGVFDIIAKPLLYLLKFFYQFTHNYGWAIVIVTIIIRILFYPLNHLSFKSMKKMQELQPIFQRLKEKYKDDPQALQREIMNLYKTHKINPFSGCLPILIQIPVFIAFYNILLMAIELRHAPFLLWISDLSSPERIYLGSWELPLIGGIPLLTILMGASMFIQQKLTPTTMDPTQEKIMLILPIIFTIIFINFPSGLVLYWLVNNILSIIQQIVTFKLFKSR